MIFQQLDKALTNHAGRAQNANGSFFDFRGHTEILQHALFQGVILSGTRAFATRRLLCSRTTPRDGGNSRCSQVFSEEGAWEELFWMEEVRESYRCPSIPPNASRSEAFTSAQDDRAKELEIAIPPLFPRRDPLPFPDLSAGHPRHLDNPKVRFFLVYSRLSL